MAQLFADLLDRASAKARVRDRLVMHGLLVLLGIFVGIAHVFYMRYFCAGASFVAMFCPLSGDFNLACIVLGNATFFVIISRTVATSYRALHLEHRSPRYLNAILLANWLASLLLWLIPELLCVVFDQRGMRVFIHASATASVIVSQLLQLFYSVRLYIAFGRSSRRVTTPAGPRVSASMPVRPSVAFGVLPLPGAALVLCHLPPRPLLLLLFPLAPAAAAAVDVSDPHAVLRSRLHSHWRFVLLQLLWAVVVIAMETQPFIYGLRHWHEGCYAKVDSMIGGLPWDLYANAIIFSSPSCSQIVYWSPVPFSRAALDEGCEACTDMCWRCCCCCCCCCCCQPSSVHLQQQRHTVLPRYRCRKQHSHAAAHACFPARCCCASASTRHALGRHHAIRFAVSCSPAARLPGCVQPRT